jgi:hypothetical protein
MRSAANFDLDGVINPGATPASPAEAESAPPAAPPVQREQGLNFGSANPRRQERTASVTETDPAATDDDTPAPVVREPGLNFGSANPRRGPASVNDVQPVVQPLVQPVVQPLDDVGPAATSSPDQSATLNRDPPTADGDAAE